MSLVFLDNPAYINITTPQLYCYSHELVFPAYFVFLLS